MDSQQKKHNEMAPKTSWTAEFIETHLNCCLCGTPLHFSNQTDFASSQVVENAHCPACGVRTRSTTHVLH